MGEIERYEALIARADALGDEADRLVTGSVNVSNTAARAIADDVLRLVADYRGAVEALGDAYSALTDGEGLGPDVSTEAVEQAREIIAAALVAAGGQ